MQQQVQSVLSPSLMVQSPTAVVSPGTPHTNISSTTKPMQNHHFPTKMESTGFSVARETSEITNSGRISDTTFTPNEKSVSELDFHQNDPNLTDFRPFSAKNGSDDLDSHSCSGTLSDLQRSISRVEYTTYTTPRS